MSSGNGDAPDVRPPPGGYACGACGATRDTPAELAEHARQAHPDDDD